MKILAIETSCDETAIAIAEFTGPKSSPQISILSNIVSSQISLHRKFGGVVPNLARREHEKNLTFILERALKEARFSNSKSQLTNHKQIPNPKIKKIEKILEREPELLKQFKKHILPIAPPEIDAIAVTYGPGLAPALWVGVNFARALAVLWNKPLIPINHMTGHFYSALLQVEPRIPSSQFPISKQIQNSKLQIQNVSFPALGLLVSGGHTELVYAKEHGKWKIIGETRDDAAGEAFDKVARILGLPYPGGPAISAIAEMELKVKNEKLKITLPRPMIATNDFDFSFSGLKTAVLYLVRDLGAKQTKKLRPVIAKEFQDAVVDVLVKKTVRAAKTFKTKTVLLGGGVAANHELRKRLEANLKKELPNTKYLIPDTDMTGDNALMIALAAYFTGKPGSNSSAAASGGKTRSGRRLLPGKKKAWNKVHADANARLGS